MSMTPEKIQEVCTLYIGGLADRTDGEALHIVYMCHQIPEFVKADRREKAMRWLGFVQGWLWATKLYTIDEMADHNRPEEERGV